MVISVSGYHASETKEKVWENKKFTAKFSDSSQVFQVLPNFHEMFLYDLICNVFLLENHSHSNY